MVCATGNVDEKTLKEVVNFLISEAELLDQHRYKEWLELLTDDVQYLMPVRITREKEAGQYKKDISDSQYHFIDNKKSLLMRVMRYDSEYAWAENPPSRTKHFISNVKVEKSDKENEVKVKCYVLFYRSRRDVAEPEILAYERYDTLRKIDGKWKLAKRLIIPENAVLPVINLSNFL
jgi:ethylbenzene dioxygenase beta subunit